MDPKDLSTTPWYLDKSWYLAVLALLAPLLAKYFGVQLDATTIVAVVLPVVALIVASKNKQAQVLTAQINNGHFDNPPTPVSLVPPAEVVVPVAPAPALVLPVVPVPPPAAPVALPPPPVPVLACVTCGAKLAPADAQAHQCPPVAK